MASPQNALRSASPAQKVTAFVGAGESLGIKTGSVSDLIRAVTRGFSYRTLLSFKARTGVSISALAESLGIPERTLARRRSAGRLAPEESEKLLRLSSLFEKAVDLFEGDAPSAVRWLSTPKRALDNHIPLEYARTEIGARQVENLIGRLEHGVFS